MCGIAGYLGPREIPQQVVEACLSLMHRRGPERIPRAVALRLRIVVDIPVANGRDRPPELVVVLGVEYSHHRIGRGHSQQGVPEAD